MYHTQLHPCVDSQCDVLTPNFIPVICLTLFSDSIVIPPASSSSEAESRLMFHLYDVSAPSYSWLDQGLTQLGQLDPLSRNFELETIEISWSLPAAVCISKLRSTFEVWPCLLCELWRGESWSHWKDQNEADPHKKNRSERWYLNNPASACFLFWGMTDFPPGGFMKLPRFF